MGRRGVTGKCRTRSGGVNTDPCVLRLGEVRARGATNLEMPTCPPGQLPGLVRPRLLGVSPIAIPIRLRDR